MTNTGHINSTDTDKWTWIMLVIMLVLGGVIGLGCLFLTHHNSQNEAPTGNQATPSYK